MTALLPDWVIAVTAMAAIAVFVTGRVRIAVLLAMPALLRFAVWPAALGLIRGIPLLWLVPALLLAGALVLALIAVRTSRSILILFVGREAADHAIGRAVGQGLIHLFAKRR